MRCRGSDAVPPPPGGVQGDIPPSAAGSERLLNCALGLGECRVTVPSTVQALPSQSSRLIQGTDKQEVVSVGSSAETLVFPCSEGLSRPTHQ